MTFGISTRLRALSGGADALVARVRPHLSKVVAGLLAVGLACVDPAAATVAAPAPRLIGSVTPPPSGTFLGSHEPGRAGVESSALALANATGGLPAGGHGLTAWLQASGALVGADRCPPSALEVSWVPPVGDHRVGGYVAPLGPPPDEHTTRVNGVVVCRTSDYAFLGFEALWDGARWRLSAVPSLAADEEAPLLEGEAEAEGAAPAVAGATDPGDGPPALPQSADWDGAALETPAIYVPQTTCDPTAKPGVLGFRDLLLTAFPGSRNLGIGRVCEAEGVSEHKEGRAFDWGVAAANPGERAAAETVLAWLLSPDGHGEPFAMARRLGLMYVIWDGQIWSAFRAADGWRPYVGVSEHRDHIHFSFDWPGALGQTSFWRGGSAHAGSVMPDLPLAPVTRPAPALPFGALPPGVVLPPIPLPPGLVAPSSSSAEEPPPSTTTTSTTTTTTTAPPPSTTTTTSPPQTTTTTSPVLTLPSSPPTSLRVGSL
jgi:hypothetical protein